MNELYGRHTRLSVSHSPASGTRLDDLPELLRGYAHVKMACARANIHAGVLDIDIGEAIQTAAREVAAGTHYGQFPAALISGGTATNMNVNEVLAARASQLLDGTTVHPNDHVNKSQSSNDVFPTAVALCCLSAVTRPLASLDRLVEALRVKAAEYQGWRRLGRTSLQDAVTVPVSATHSAQATGLTRTRTDLDSCVQRLRTVPLGGTAVGTGVGAPEGFAALAVAELSDVSGYDLTPAPDLFDAYAHSDPYSAVAAAARRAASVVYKIAADLRLLSSGPAGGLGELQLPALQPGSSIMPGKVNPTIPSLAMQLVLRIRGAVTTVDAGVDTGELELAGMTPIILEALLSIFADLADAAGGLAEKCVPGLAWNADSLAAKVAVALDQYVDMAGTAGYDAAASAIKEAR